LLQRSTGALAHEITQTAPNIYKSGVSHGLNVDNKIVKKAKFFLSVAKILVFKSKTPFISPRNFKKDLII